MSYGTLTRQATTIEGLKNWLRIYMRLYAPDRDSTPVNVYHEMTAKNHMKRIFSPVLLSLLVLCSYYAQAIDPDKVVEIIKNKEKYPNYSLVAAHRGYWKDVPENSTAAFDDAIALGADLVEVDVRLTKDNVLVAFHDPCLDRLTSESGPINQYDWKDIQDLRLKDVTGELTTYKILSLEEVVKYIGDRIVISLDVKVHGTDYQLVFLEAVKIFRANNILDHLVIKGNLSPDQLSSILKASDTNLGEILYTPVLYNSPFSLGHFKTFLANDQIYAMELIYKRDSDPVLKDGYVRREIQANKWVGTYSFWPELCGGVIYQDAQTCRMDTWEYNFINGITPDNESSSDPDAPDFDPDKYFFDDGRGGWDWLVSNGANYIITDRPALMIDYLKAIGQRQL